MNQKTPTMRFKSNPHSDDSVVKKMAERVSLLKAKSTEEFLKKLGVNESNASEFHFETELQNDLARDIKFVVRNGVRIAAIESYFSTSFSDGMKFVVDCRDLRELDSPTKQQEKPKPKPKLPPEQWELALQQCHEISGLCDELPDAACDFAISVSEGVQEVAEWIEENKHVTEAQLEALGNWQSGCERWIH